MDFGTTDGERLRTLLPTISNKILEWDLKVNDTKTEHTHIERHTDRTTKKLGSLLGDAEDMLRRQQLATVAFGKLWTLWIRRSLVSESFRIRLYNAFVLPVLCYKWATSVPTKQQLSRIEAFHRKQLRALIGIVFPNRIRNERLYERTGAVPLGIIILRARWSLFGHVLRLPADSPPPLAMGAYFTEPRPAGWRRRPIHTLPTLLQDDAKRIGLFLSSKVDLRAFFFFLRPQLPIMTCKAAVQHRRHESWTW